MAATVKQSAVDGNDLSSGHSRERDRLSSDVGSRKVLPSDTRSWHLSDILDLKITPVFVSQKTPMDFVNMLHIRPSRAILCAQKRTQTIADRLKLNNFGFLDKEFESITSETSYAILRNPRLWSVKEAVEGLQNEDEWNCRFLAHGQDFALRLHDLVTQKEKDDGGEISESMFQFLFDSFTRMFGFKSRHASCIPMQSMEISNNFVSGCPDLLYKKEKFPHPTETDHNLDDWTTIAVCKVKSSYNQDCSPSPPKLRRTSTPATGSSSDGIEAVNSLSAHVAESLLGQHCGELLLYYPSSIKEHMILGILVQKTDVTFTSLCLNLDQFDQIKKGTLKLDQVNGPRLLYSRPYNYLLKKDREDLIEPMILLGLMQSTLKV